MTRALVTGSSAGLGRAIASDLVSRWFEVVGLDRATSERATWSTILCDLSDRAAVRTASDLLATQGPFDLVFHNAGINATGQFEAVPIEAHLKLLAINVEAPLEITRTLLAANALSGTVCFVASLSLFTGYPGAASYGACKDAIAVYAKSLRKAGISTTIACPGPLDTEHAARHAPNPRDRSRRMAPETAARIIVSAAIRGKRYAIPGIGPKIAVAFGTCFPSLTTRLMRRLLFERMEKAVW